ALYKIAVQTKTPRDVGEDRGREKLGESARRIKLDYLFVNNGRLQGGRKSNELD
ncbi:hypothetical protein TRAPUB_6844, partial [Trametes pubescens]